MEHLFYCCSSSWSHHEAFNNNPNAYFTYKHTYTFHMCLSQAKNLSSVVVFVHELSSVFLFYLYCYKLDHWSFLLNWSTLFYSQGLLRAYSTVWVDIHGEGRGYPPVNLFCNTLGRCMGCCVIDLIWFLVFNATFNNIPVISWRPVLVVEEAGENHRPWASN